MDEPPKTCALCGKELDPEDKFCSRCGARIVDQTQIQEEGKASEISTFALVQEAVGSLFNPSPVGPPPSSAVYRNRPPRPLTRYLIAAIILTAFGLFAGYGEEWTRYLGLTIGGYAAPLAYLAWIFRSDRYEREPLSLVLYMFGWGALAGILASILNAFVLPVFGVPGAAFVEEPLKILGVYLLSRRSEMGSELNDHLDGMVYGAAAGAGFAGLENLYYILQMVMSGGVPAVAAILVRTATSMGHIAWSAFVGRSMGLAKALRGRSRLRDLIPGLMIAIPLHFLWNSLPPLLGLGTILPFITYALTRQVDQAIKDEEGWGYRFHAPDESMT
ncbi:MAG: PrsW family glutamic-type intramembrane protease [Candidatus Bathyarchaeia archaeon]